MKKCEISKEQRSEARKDMNAARLPILALQYDLDGITNMGQSKKRALHVCLYSVQILP
jgi:hypothetical protein